MIQVVEPQPWSEPAVPSFVPFVANVRLEIRRGKRRHLGPARRSSTVAALKALRPWLSCEEKRRMSRQLVGMQVEAPEAGRRRSGG